MRTPSFIRPQTIINIALLPYPLLYTRVSIVCLLTLWFTVGSAYGSKIYAQQDSLNTQAQPIPPTVVGYWKIALVENEMTLALDTLPAKVRQQLTRRLEEMHTHSYFDFREDGQYEIVMGYQPTPARGQWRYDAANKHLYITNSTGSEKVIEVERLSNQQFVIKTVNIEDGRASRLTLVPAIQDQP
ncbi:hypothetical protein [Eisenibacter elegans]|uniref:hypothetical protein n=1 Tax=Eisenibacter elegans TaxID=997 RepID=UPI0003F6472E|nr:hypothetical protein [Eisenibacter elegans]